jgi:hypothetical protein
MAEDEHSSLPPPELEAPSSLYMPISPSPAASAAAATAIIATIKYADFKKKTLAHIKFLRLLVKELGSYSTRDEARKHVRDMVRIMNEKGEGFYIDFDNANERQTVAVLSDLLKYLEDNPREHPDVRDGLVAMLKNTAGGPQLEMPKVRSYRPYKCSYNLPSSS